MMWIYNCSTYKKEAIHKAEEILVTLPKSSTPLPVKECHPELDQSPLLDLHWHRQYQILLGMLQWNYSIGRIELGPAVSSLNRFGTCPRENHLELIKLVFSYLKYSENINCSIAIDSNPMNYERQDPHYEELILNFLQDYPDAKEDVDPYFPESY